MSETSQQSKAPPFSNWLRPPFAAIINHLLKSASWARVKLQPYAGKTVLFAMSPFKAAFLIDQSGTVQNQDQTADAVYDVTITLTPGVALRVAAGDESAWREAQVAGDTGLARELLAITQNLRWDYEEDLSRVFGDVAAHRMAEAARGLKRWQQNSSEHLARSAAQYWTEERPLIASKQDIERYSKEVDRLRDDVERLAQRIARFKV